ncbi:MAG: DNA-binding response regulator [Acidobacteria bacterium]|nr:MAG: DNA-binding response regulator [Acidobacteriota bacterium]
MRTETGTTERTHERVRLVILAAHAVVRAGLRHLLDNRDDLVVVGEASSCEEAAAMAERERPDVLIVDPDAEQITLRALPALAVSAGRIIVLTAAKDNRVHARAVQLGAAGVVCKDQPGELLVRAVEKVHAGEVWLDRAKTAGLINLVLRRQRDPEIVKIETLTKREKEIVRLVANGLKNSPIAEQLFISEATVRNHLTSILSKLELSDRFELAVYAFRHGLVDDALMHSFVLGSDNGNTHVDIA